MHQQAEASRQDPPQQEGEGLVRKYGLSTTTYVVIASMVGTGVLTTSGFSIKATGSGTLMLALWLVGGVLAICGALTVAELAAAMPRAGGEYAFVREAYGEVWAFLYGWVSFLIGFSAPAALSAYAAALYLTNPVLEGRDYQGLVVQCVAALFVIGLTIPHLRGHAAGARVQKLTTVLKLSILVGLAVAGLAFRRGSLAHLSPDVPDEIAWGALGISLVYTMFSYSGWNAASYLAGEVQQPARVLPRALLIGCGSVVTLYLVLNLVYLYALPPSEVVAMPISKAAPIAATAAERLFGPWVAKPFSVAVGVGLLASLSAYIMTGPRVYHAMAVDGLFPAVAARLNPRTHVPQTAILVQSCCSLVLLFTGSFENILSYVGVGLSISSFFVILSVFVLRLRRPDIVRPFRVPLFPLPPVLFLACAGWMVIFAFGERPLWSGISVGSILAGIPVYYLVRKPGRQPGGAFPVVAPSVGNDPGSEPE